MILQMVDVGVPASDFLRVDKSGRIIAAATNTTCAPRRGDVVYLLRPKGKVELNTTFDVTTCHWMGDFTVPGRFQVQDCRIDPRHDR